MDKIEKKIIELIDANREEIIAAGQSIWKNAEMGYKEFKTSKLFSDKMKQLGFKTKENLAITGVKSYLKDEHNGRTVCLMGELDALPISSHPDANKETGASHCCGHNAQITAVLGAAIALADEEIKSSLDGNVVFFAVPAEEFVDIEFKLGLMKEGKISYGGGKCELIKLGEMDDIDLTVGYHTSNDTILGLGNNSTNGFVNKIVNFKGMASHAAGSPHRGVDALAAYNIAAHALDAQRETFKDSDTVRVHGFVSDGGKAMNVIADKVTAEYSVRAKNIPAFVDASAKFDRAMTAGAMAMGAGLEIVTMPGYLPTVPCNTMDTMVEVLNQVSEVTGYPATCNLTSGHGTGSTDYGDVSALMPLLQFKAGGYDGILHNDNMRVTDEELAYITAAKVYALTAYKLLKNKGEQAEKVIQNFVPTLSKQEYLDYMDSMNKTTNVAINQLPVLD